MLRHRGRRNSRTPTTYDIGIGGYGCVNRELLRRLALLLVAAMLLCGVGAGVSFLIQVGLDSRGTAASGISVLHEPTSSERAANASIAPSTAPGISREYLASNLSLLLGGGWPSGARFHPAPFLPSTDVLNMTVLCDSPTARDATLVYSEPTWLCKNVRVVNRSRADGEGTQRLPFSDSASRTLEEMILSRKKELQQRRDGCGHLPDRRDNVLLLCEMLLTGLRRGYRRPRWAGAAEGPTPQASSAHIPRGNCSQPDQKRILLVGMATEDAVWYTEESCKRGFVTDLFCSF